jgi:hypothetical protein
VTAGTVVACRRPRTAEDAARTGLARLARDWDDDPDVLALKALVHPSLRQGYALDRIWGDYRHILGILDDFDHGIGSVDWHQFGGEYETARENVRGEAEYAVLDLIHGITGSRGSAA